MMITVNNVTYFCRKQGNGPAILFLHGFTGDHSTWTHITACLQDHFTVISLDLLGHGRTSAPADYERYQIEKNAEDIAAILEQLGIDKTYLVGYSMGGRLALTFAKLYPEKVISLILESASPGLATIEEREERVFRDKQLADMIETQGIEKFVDYWQEIPLFLTQKKLSQQLQNAIRAQRLQQDPVGLSGSLRGMGTGSQPSLWSCLKDFLMPVLLICGELDKKFCTIAEEMAERIPYAKIMMVKDVGHAIHVEDRESFGTIVREFLLHVERSRKYVD